MPNNTHQNFKTEQQWKHIMYSKKVQTIQQNCIFCPKKKCGTPD